VCADSDWLSATSSDEDGPYAPHDQFLEVIDLTADTEGDEDETGKVSCVKNAPNAIVLCPYIRFCLIFLFADGEEHQPPRPPKRQRNNAYEGA
jgi:hypothetical protein